MNSAFIDPKPCAYVYIYVESTIFAHENRSLHEFDTGFIICLE